MSTESDGGPSVGLEQGGPSQLRQARRVNLKWAGVTAIVLVLMGILLLRMLPGKPDPEYANLVKAVENAPGATLTTSYRTGPTGRQLAIVTLSRREGQGLVLVSALPEEAVKTVDPATGRLAPGTKAWQITMLDQDLDGQPDYFRMGPGGEPADPEDKLTKGGLVRLRNSAEHQVIKAVWKMDIGYCINHFLHGVDSPPPWN